jgi:thiol-disulfide isomerase/thioredoxin
MKYQQLFSKKMFFPILMVGAFIGLVVWNYYIDPKMAIDVQIPTSKNISYNNQEPVAMSTASFINDYEGNEGKVILLYFYTSWCGVCKKNLPIFNEMAREFQNTDLYVMAIALDRDIDAQYLQSYLNQQGDIYFRPRYLAFREGFLEFLKKKNINYRGIVPFTVLISRDSEVVAKYNGYKSKEYLRNQIIKALYK